MTKLNLGCGAHPREEYVNVDCQEQYKPDVLSNINDLLYPPGSIEEIYISHVLEHMATADCRAAVAHMHKWLKPGGKIYVSVPNLTKVCRALADGDEEHIVFCWLYGSGDGSALAHRWNFTEKTLIRFMGDIGFKKVGEWTPAEIGVTDDSKFRRGEDYWSLN